MANDFTSNEMTFFEDVLMGFDSNNITAKNVNLYEPGMQSVERSGLTVRRPIPMIAETTTGRDVSSDYKDVLELTVPSTLAESDILNHAFKLNAIELNDPTRRQRAAKAAAQGLGAKIDTITSERVINYGSLVLAETGDFTDYDALAKGETALMEREVNNLSNRCLILNPRMSRKMANELGSRATDNGRDRSAYERSLLPPVGGFETLKANVLTSLTGSAASGVTVNGANQRKTVTVFDGTNSSAADNRSMTLAVSASHGMVAGDCFTIAGVNSIGMITKKDTGTLQTFRVTAVSGNDLTISPAIIPEDESATANKKYGNVTTTPANGAAITLLNTDTVQPSIFFCKEAVEIFHGRFNVEDFQGGGVAVTKEVSDSGIEIIFAKSTDIDTLETKYRLSCWAAANVLEPQMAGIYLRSQNAAFG